MSITEIKNLLKEKNIRVTEKKSAILHAIIEHSSPVNVNEIYRQVSSELPVDLATVYRTVNTLVSLSLIREITDSSGTQYFEYIDSNKPDHPHFKCIMCRRLFCMECNLTKTLTSILTLMKILKSTTFR